MGLGGAGVLVRFVPRANWTARADVKPIKVVTFRFSSISDLMNISFETVRTHGRSIYEKLHVHSRTEATLKYLGH